MRRIMARITNKVKCDKRGLTQLRSRYKKLDDWGAQAGFYREQKHPNGKLDAAHLAVILNYGHEESNIPPRPFIVDGAQDSLIELRSMFISRFYQFVVNKQSPQNTLQPIAEAMARWIAQRILFNNYERNAEYTVERKGFNRPLFETGWLAENVMTKVKRKGG